MGSLKVNLCGIELDNPIIPASGTFGFGYEFAELYDINELGTFSFKKVTKFSLKKVTNASGIAYSQAQFAVERVLTAEEMPFVQAMSDQVKSFATRVAYDDAPSEIIDPVTGEVFDPENPFT